VVEEYDNVTKLYSHKHTYEQILEVEKHKGIFYHRRGKEGTSNSQPNFPNVTTPTQNQIVNLNVDLGSWISNVKVLVCMSDLLKIPSQKEKLMQDINPPSNKVVPSNTFSPKDQEMVK
jgi:hypothetical protein